MSAEEAPTSRVLVLDDDEIMRDLVTSLLEMYGIAVVAAASGEEALARLGETAFGWVLTDLHLPGLEGEALLRSLRDGMAGEALLIGMSGSHPEKAELAQLDAFLSKPFSTGHLQAALRAAEDRAAQRERQRLVPEPLAERPRRSGPEQAPVLDEMIFASLATMLPLAQLDELYRLTLNDIDSRYTRMVADAASGTWAAVRREAHAIKGSCGMVGALELSELAAIVEGGTIKNTPALAEFPAACHRLQRMLDAKFQTA